MGLWGKPDVAALCIDAAHNRVSGVRMHHSGNVLEVVKNAVSADADVTAAVATVVRELSISKDVWLILGMNIEQGAVMECTVPDAKVEDMAGAIGFEAAHEIIQLPEDCRVEFVKRSAPDENGSVKVRGYVFPNGALMALAPIAGRIRRKIDAFLYPLLALPKDLPETAKIYIPELEADYFFQNGVWNAFDAHTAPGDCNAELLQRLKHDCHWRDAGEADWQSYIGALTMAHFAYFSMMDDPATAAGVNVLPKFLRPARCRNQIRVMMLLVTALAVLWGIRGVASLVKGYSRYSEAYTELSQVKNKVEKMRKKLKSGEKTLKEQKRIVEYSLGSRDCLGYLGLLSESLPEDVLVSSYRWNEGSIDLMLQTMTQDMDLVSFCNRLRGFKVVSANQRTNSNNNLTVATVKLSTDLTPAKAKSKKKGKK